ncbi:MAG TPA: hypothetical protein VJ824_06155 [Bacillota bacterium]|nr:hypothetical protein [Bacillota bacterium]
MGGKLSWDYVEIVHQELYSLRSDYFMIVFGVTTGLLALIGFVSFYIINNSKQKAEDLQKLAWRLEASKYKPFHRKLIDETIELFFVYKKTIEQRRDFSFEMLSLLRWTLYFVLFTWLATFVLLDSLIEFLGFGLFYAIAGSLMLAYIFKLKKFRDSLLQGPYSNFTQFLDSYDKDGMGKVWLAGMMSKLDMKRDPKNAQAFSVYFGLPSFASSYLGPLQLHQTMVHFCNEGGLIQSTPFFGQALSIHATGMKQYDWFEMEAVIPIVCPEHTTSMEIELFLTRNNEGKKAEQDSAVAGIWLRYSVGVNYLSILSNHDALYSPSVLSVGEISEYEIGIHEEQARKNEAQQRELQTV